jgi:hypothetical protein
LAPNVEQVCKLFLPGNADFQSALIGAGSATHCGSETRAPSSEQVKNLFYLEVVPRRRDAVEPHSGEDAAAPEEPLDVAEYPKPFHTEDDLSSGTVFLPK